LEKLPTVIPVVAVALVRQDGHVLMQQRPFGKAHGGLWEFPGGKVDAGESLDSALIREIDEELGIGLDAETLTPLTFAAIAGEPFVILLYTCRQWRGEPRCLEGEAIGWFAPAELEGLEMPPLDVPLVKTLKGVI
jgi:8-oxo-dGTP diphosphatase